MTNDTKEMLQEEFMKFLDAVGDDVKCDEAVLRLANKSIVVFEMQATLE